MSELNIGRMIKIALNMKMKYENEDRKLVPM
jgi:hypothetical protein